MVDFLMISYRGAKRGSVMEIYPRFVIKRSSDLMIRGGDFYAIWLEDKGMWSSDEQDALELIDRELDKFAKQNKDAFECEVRVLYMWDAASGMIDHWHKYCQRQMRDNFHMLDERIIFANTEPKKTDYASKKLPYSLEKGDSPAYDKLASVLYSEEERHKIEWCIGAIVSGASRQLQKFMVLYGAVGTGKSTIINIIQQLFNGYYESFEAKTLGSANSAFALEAFRSNPMIAIQHDGDLSRIEDNTRLNSLVSHEKMTVNEKFRSAYTNQFKSFLIMGTNKPVKITDAKSGLIRRLIDVSPTGNKIPRKEYDALVQQVGFELGAIAYRCQDVYLRDPNRYDAYIPVAMLGASNDFYNFVIDSYHVFKKEDGVTLKAAWEMYKIYCDEAKVPYPYPQRSFKEELKNYFRDYKERFSLEDGARVRSYYSGFKTESFEDRYEDKEPAENDARGLIIFDGVTSVLDAECSDCVAQYATAKETPTKKWSDVTTTLGDLDASKLHYVKLPENHIVIDFDVKGTDGKKSLDLNVREASKWPATYAELSKSGEGVHLHYIYSGEVTKLSGIYDENIEVKVFTGNSALRRKLTKCNSLPIATISSGIPLKISKEGDHLVNFENVKSEKSLRTLIKRNLAKEIHAGTKPSVDFINKVLEDAYNGGLCYDVTDMRNVILAFAANSTNQAGYCIKLVNGMKFKSDEISPDAKNEETTLVFYDVEVFPNLFVVCWKVQGEGKPTLRMINPSSSEIEELMRFRLVGFNCRRYDNHILYARLMGYTEKQLYDLSRRIISGSANCFFGEAYNVSYTDVYDFSSVKQSLKKFEIDLGVHHQELGLPWDRHVPEEMWPKVAEYCDNDVMATEAVFNGRKSDFLARQILADLAGMSVNDTTNTLTTRIIFGGNRKPQEQFNYRNMGESPNSDDILDRPFDYHNEFTVFVKGDKPIFPGYKYENGKSAYRGEDVGEGGYVYAEPGIYHNVAVLDIASMHPSSIVAEKLFGETYTQRFKDILDARIAVKHKDFDKARSMLGGALAPYLTDESAAKDLASALKIAINSVYGLTSANFDNPFRDIRNRDNIVAKRGALFMINLKHEVQARGYISAHIKTDSIKIPNATQEIIKFVTDYGKQYGYDFEHETTYDRMCLVNDAVYIAAYFDDEHVERWTATGTQFAVPYVFKTLFSKEDITFDDMCVTKSVTSALYLDMNEGLPDDEHNYRFVGKVGRFCPIKPGCGGGVLLRETTSKTGEKTFAAATGSKGYRWMEAEIVRELGKEAIIDRSYYDKLVEGAKKSISEYGDFDEFVDPSPF